MYSNIPSVLILLLNPAYAGSSEDICASIIQRSQWIGFEGAPNVQVFNVQAPFKLFGRKHGVGISFLRDALGFNEDFNGKISYSYKVNTGAGNIGIGISAGIYKSALKFKSGETWETIGGSATDDPLIPEEQDTRAALDLGFGFYYNSEDLYIGLSSARLNNPRIADVEKSGLSGQVTIGRNFFITSGYRIQLSNPLIELLPGINIRSDGASTSIDLNSMVEYNKKIWAGVSYRTGDAIIPFIGVELLNGVRLGIAYDFVTSEVGKNTNFRGGYEIMVNYCFNLRVEKKPMGYKSVRFL
ncbi:PorP/SprF family type IX secretion system membrane protein [Bacteroidota bacterium]